MADKNIGLLPQASTLTDNSSFVCEDSGEAKRVTGKQFKDFAKEGALPAVKAAENAADRSEAALTKAPKIQNGTWWVFDASSQAYVDTGVKAQGERGIQGERGETGAPGQPGEKGDPFRYEDFTPEQLDDLERGAKAAQAAAETAAASAATSAVQASVSEQNAAESASAAKASEDAAKASETSAAGSSSSAQESAASASASASEASASATAAAASETSAVEAKTAAETAKTDAGKSASAAKKSETASKSSETAAAGSASAAQQSASAAEGSATAAAQSAASIGNAEQVVTQKAEEASTSAANAAASAESAARSAEHAEQVVGGNFATKTEAQGYANTAESNAKSYTDQQISAIPTPDVSGQIGEHNTNTEAHNDIRNLITGLTNRLNALADSDDTTLDQLSEIVAYIKNNKALIDGITTSKVNVDDIINNLTTNVSNKPLSAAQGVALKALIDAITVPTKVSELENDSGYLTGYTETDPTVPAWAKAETKPIYTADEVGARPNTWMPSASDVGAIPTSEKGAANGVATLGTDGKVPESQLPSLGFKPQIVVTAPTGSTVTATHGSKVYTASESSGTWTFKVDDYGTYTITATKDGKTATGEVIVEAVQQYAVELKYIRIYGVTWDGTSTTVWSRTDDAANFVNPTPYVSGASSYGSPFDDLYPWNGMVRVTDSEAGELVAIPKFWYKWTKSGNSLKLQIADKQADGFYTSPAHADRGDGKGERDVVYIGRYHCHTSNYKSQTGGKPKASITRKAARSGIHALGSTIWQSDIQLRMTIWMLYLVEFADWNTQKTIGKGCGNNSATQNMGYTDSMPYHTGTTKTSRDTYGLGTQYRYIEGLWDNVYDWGDGCYYNSNGLNIIMNPSNFSDSSGGTAVGVPSSGWPSAFTVATVAGLEWVIYPTATGGSESTYSSDIWAFSASDECLRFGGSYNQNGDYGLFFVYYCGASLYDTDIGCRLQKLP